MSLFDTGVRPIVDAYLLEESKKVRSYGEYWSASSSGYCMRKNIFERLGVPHVETESDARKQRVFTAGHIFHNWLQDLTKQAGVSIAQEVELLDDDLMIKGHFDDLVLVQPIIGEQPLDPQADETDPDYYEKIPIYGKRNLILYDYKTVNSRSFMWARKEKKATGEAKMSHYHRMQLGTYLYMLRNGVWPKTTITEVGTMIKDISEARILKIEKDTLMMDEQQLMWSPELEKEVVGYWRTLNGYWKAQKLPKCTCADFEGGFMAREGYNPYYFEGEPCSMKWFAKCKAEGTIKAYEEKK